MVVSLQGSPNKSFVVWVTGLSGSGKTTISRVLHEKMKPELRELVLLDGDEIRAAFGHDLGYSEPDRVVQVQRVQRLAQMLTAQGLSVIVAVVYCNPELMRWNRENIDHYLEVSLETSMDILIERDSKGLYPQEGKREARDVVGVDIPWIPPLFPDIKLNTDGEEKPESLAAHVLKSLRSSGLISQT